MSAGTPAVLEGSSDAPRRSTDTLAGLIVTDLEAAAELPLLLSPSLHKRRERESMPPLAARFLDDASSGSMTCRKGDDRWIRTQMLHEERMQCTLLDSLLSMHLGSATSEKL